MASDRAQPGNLVQIGGRLALVLKREPKRLHVQYESDGTEASIGVHHARALVTLGSAAAGGGAMLCVGDAVDVRAGSAGGAPGDWRTGTLFAIARGESLDTADAAGGLDGGSVRFCARFDDGTQAWRRPTEVRPSVASAAIEVKKAAALGAGRASRSKLTSAATAEPAIALDARLAPQAASAAGGSSAQGAGKRPAEPIKKQPVMFKIGGQGPLASELGAEAPTPAPVHISRGARKAKAAVAGAGAAGGDGDGDGDAGPMMGAPGAPLSGAGGASGSAAAMAAVLAAASVDPHLLPRLAATADSDDDDDEPGAAAAAAGRGGRGGRGKAPARAVVAPGGRGGFRAFTIGGQAALPGEGAARGAAAAAAAAENETSDSDSDSDGGGDGGGGGADNAPGARWCGPWSTTRELLRKRKAAAEERSVEIAHNLANAAAVAAAQPVWLPAKRARADAAAAPELAASGPPPASLRSQCVALVARHIDSVSSFGQLPTPILNLLQAALARRRALTREAAMLFAGDRYTIVTELVLDDCCLLSEEDLTDALLAVGADALERRDDDGGAMGAPPLTVLCLGNCGRGFTRACAELVGRLSAQGDPAAGGDELSDALSTQREAVAAQAGPSSAAAPPPPREGGRLRLRHLALGSCYKLPAAAIATLLGHGAVGARLHTLQITYSPIVDARVTEAIGAHCARTLQGLALDHCNRLDDAALRHLASLRALVELSLAGLPRASGDGIVSLLTSPIDAPPAAASTTPAAAAGGDGGGAGDGVGACVGGALELLSLAENPQLTDEAVVALVAHCGARLHTLDLSGLSALSDVGASAVVGACGALRCVRLRGCTELSDAAVVALAEGRGDALVELSLNGCHLISNTSVCALEQHCARGLASLDLSWCRRVSDGALGRLADAVSEDGHAWARARAGAALPDGPGGRSVLPSLRLWGMTQLTDTFHQGHRLPAGIIQGTPECRQLQAGHARAGAPSGTHWSVRNREHL